MYPVRAPGILSLTCSLAGLLSVFAAHTQEAEPAPASIPWQKIETWALTAPDSPGAVKEQPKETVKPISKEVPAEVVKDVPKDVPTDTPKDAPKEPIAMASNWAPQRPGERRPEPPAYKTMQEQVMAVMGMRLKDTQNTNYRKQAEIYMTLEQYDKSVGLLNQMLSESKRWKEDAGSGWINGHLWECALLCRNKPPAAWIQQQFDEWKTKEPLRLEAYITREGYGAAYRVRMLKGFQDRQDYYTKDGSTIAEKMKDLEMKGDTSPAALAELRERCVARKPVAPLTLLRVLFKLRDWYPDLPDVKSGELSLALARQLGYGLGMYREGSKEAESLMEKAPTCAEVVNGNALYLTAEFAYQHAEHLAPDPDDGWTLSDRTRPVHKEAREYWERARQLFLRLKKEYPKNGNNELSSSTGLSAIDSRLNFIARPERLGPPKPQ